MALDEPLVELETDKVTLEVVLCVRNADRNSCPEGETVEVGVVIGRVTDGVQAPQGRCSSHPLTKIEEGTPSSSP